MKNRKSLQSLYKLCFLLLITSGGLMAQQFFPVVARVTQTPPYPIYLTDLSNPAQQSLSIQVQMKDLTIASRIIRLRMHMQGNGLSVSSIDKVQGESNISLVQGQIFNLPTSLVANYFKSYNLKISQQQYLEPFKEGTFRFGVEVIDAQTGRPLSGIQWGPLVWLTVNEPPVWVLPINSTNFLEPSTPQNIIFQWAPRHKNVSDVDYEFVLTDLNVNSGFKGDIQNLFLAQPAYYKSTTKSTTLNYNATLPPLIPGRTYAYRVQAKAKQGLKSIGIFRNNGFSEIRSFTYSIEPEPPFNLSAKWTDKLGETIFNWIGRRGHENFKIEYRQKNDNQNWKPITQANNSIFLVNSKIFQALDPTKNYEFRVTGLYATNQQATSTILKLARLTDEEINNRKDKEFNLKGTVKWAFRASETSVTNTIPIVSSKIFPRRTKEFQLIDVLEKNNHPLSQAIVKLGYSNGPINLNRIPAKEIHNHIKIVETVSTDADGNFKFGSLKYRLSEDKTKKYYLHIKYKNSAFDERVVEINISPNGSLNKNFQNLVLAANTFRFRPRIIFESGKSYQDLEKVSLYRLKKVADQYSYLTQEGDTGARETVQYNNSDYVRISTLNPQNLQTKLFYNSLYNDNLILGILGKGKSEVFFPINSIGQKSNLNLGILVEDYFRYISPATIISGIVLKTNAQLNAPIAGSTVNFAEGITKKIKLFGRYAPPRPGVSSISGSLGNYKIVIDDDAKKGPYEGSATYEGDFHYRNIIFTGQNITQDFYINETAYAVHGIVKDENGVPFSGAKVVTENGTITTNIDGYFATIVLGKSGQKIVVLADGKEPKNLELSDFKESVEFKIDNSNRGQYFSEFLKSEIYDSLKNSTQRLYTPASVVRQYDTDFKKNGLRAGSFFENANILLYDKSRPLSIKTYLSGKNGAKEYVQTIIVLNGKSIQVPTSGYFEQTEVRNFEFTQNPLKDNAISHVFKEFRMPAPRNMGRLDTMKFEIKVDKSVLLVATLLDSTEYLDSTNLSLGYKPVAFAKVEGEDLKFKTTTNADGVFKILLKDGKEDNLSFFKEGYQLTKYHLKIDGANLTQNPTYYIKAMDKNVPRIKTLMSFEITLETAVKLNSGSNITYAISGLLKLPPDGIFTSSASPTLSFKEIPVSIDVNNKTNALILDPSITFEETVLNAKLFDYAKVSLESTPNKEKAFKLLPVQDGSSFGKIDVANIYLNEEKIMGKNILVTLGKVKLVAKTSVKGAVTFNDSISKAKAGNVAFQNMVDGPTSSRLQGVKPDKLDKDRSPVFVSPGKAIAELAKATEFNLEVQKRENYGIKTNKKDSLDKYFEMNMIAVLGIRVERETAVLDKLGIKMNGLLKFPLMKKFGFSKPPIINELLIDKDFEMKKISFSRGAGRTFADISAGGKYRFIVNKLEIYNKFSGFGMGGRIYTDTENYFIVNSFNIVKDPDFTYPIPGMTISFPKSGFKVGKLLMKNNKGEFIKFLYNKDDASYDIDGSVIMDLASNAPPPDDDDDDIDWVDNPLYDDTYDNDDGVTYNKNPLYDNTYDNDDGVTYNKNPLYDNTYDNDDDVTYTQNPLANSEDPNSSKTANQILPIEAQRFIIGTDGKFFMALKADWNVKLGPAKINIRRILFGKGSKVRWPEMMGYLEKTEEEYTTFSQTQTFNNANAESIKSDKNKKERDIAFAGVEASGENYIYPTVLLDESEVNWVFGMAGGVQFENIKGINAKADASFLVGDKGKGIEVSFGSIDILLENTAFKGKASIKIVNTAIKSGFEGSGEIETVKNKFAASIKFYKIPNGIEFGASLVAKTTIITGPVTWSSIGALVEFNTANKKFKVGLLGSAYPSSSRPEATEFRKIRFTVEFNPKKCGALPVIKGSMDLYLKNEYKCNVIAIVDLCNVSLLADMNCTLAIMKGANMNIKATIFVTKKSLFLGANVRTKIFAMNLNGTIVLGVNSDFNVAPTEVRYYKTYIADFMLSGARKSVLDGIYLGLKMSTNASTNGSISIGPMPIAKYNFSANAKVEMDLGYSWGNGNFQASALLEGGIKADLTVLSYKLGGEANLRLYLAGGRINNQWFVKGDASVAMKLYGGNGQRLGCNSATSKFCSYYMRVPSSLSCCCGSWWSPRRPRCSWNYKNVSIPYPCGFDFKACVSFKKSFSYKS
jgi:hypothetical protein